MKKSLFSIMVASLMLTAAFSAVGIGVFVASGAPEVPEAPEASEPTHDPETPQENAEWTIMVYMDGDGNLEYEAVGDLAQLEAVGSKNGVNVVVLMDTFDLEGLDGTHWYFVGEGNTHLDLEAGYHHCDCEAITGEPCPGELNMGDGTTLTYFIENAVEYAPAEHYMLVIWDHGGGWWGVCWDDSSPLPEDPDSGRFDRLTTEEVSAAILAAGFGPDKKLDIIGYDACLNGMIELAYENMKYADYMVASVTSIPFPGWDYTRLMQNITENPGWGPVEFGLNIVDTYIDFYDTCVGKGLQGWGSVGLSLLDLSKVQDLGTSMDAFAEAFIPIARDPANKDMIMQAAHKNTPVLIQSGENFPFVDIGVFISRIGESFPDDLGALADDVLAKLGPAVIACRYVEHDVLGPLITTNGMSVYFPAGLYHTYIDYGYETYEEAEAGGALPYFGMDFCIDTHWDELVEEYHYALDLTA